MAVNRERKMVPKEVSTLDVSYTNLGSLLKEVSELIEEYGKDAAVNKQTYQYDDGEYIAVTIMVPETDTQYAARLAYEEKWAKEAEDRDTAEFKRLQAKFGAAR